MHYSYPLTQQLRNDIVTLNSDKVKLNNEIVLLIQKQKQDLLEAEKKAQEHRVNEERAVDMYNSLVDDNKQ